jgi:hypothetical protein
VPENSATRAVQNWLRFAKSLLEYSKYGMKCAPTYGNGNTHHDQLHRSGDERAFWAQQGFRDPLKYAARLWEASRGQRTEGSSRGNETLDPDLEAEFSEPRLRNKHA